MKIKNIFFLILSILTLINFISNGIIKPAKPKNERGGGGYDFLVFYKAAQEALSDKPNLYKEVMHRKTEYNYIPIVSYAFIPLTFFSEQNSIYVWLLINVILAVASYFLLTRICGIVFQNKFYLLNYLILFNFNPLHETLKWGQVNVVVFFLILCCLYFCLKRNYITSGAFLGLSIILKILPAVFIFYFLITKKFKLAVYACFAVLLIFLISISVFGYKTHYKYFTEKIPATAGLGYKGNIYDQSFQGLCFRFFWSGNDYVEPFFDNLKFAKICSFTLRLLCFAVLAFVLTRYIKGPPSNIKILLGFSITAAGMHLFHSLTWEHHLTWSVILFVSVFAVIIQNKLNRFYLYAALISYLTVALKYGYDNKFFTQGIFILFTGIKLYGIIIIWITGILLLKNNKINFSG
ncbi:MAG TPA: glycosyltransferase family 87 protein [bacterium]|nr:glycosyltransferase family 87 protein [bacterium]HPN30481.1 glycosyltransferase family 87 protein [bacterium]